MGPGSVQWLWLSALVVVLDQASKIVVARSLGVGSALQLFPGLNLTLVHNTGAAFSFLRDAGGWQRWFFIVLTIAVSLAIMVWLVRLPAARRWLGCALGLLLGGALGNLWDRLALGYVIDFVDIYYGSWHWPAFNLADSAITAGALMLIVDALWFDRAEMSVYDDRPDKS